MEAPWMEPLEERVRRAVAEIGRLREENRRLQELLDGAGRSSADEAGGWQAEREEVRRRVERLAAQLEDLLEGET